MAKSTKKPSSVYVCSTCAHQVSKWMGRCPSCGEWGTLEERVSSAALLGLSTGLSTGRAGGLASAGANRRATGAAARRGGAQPGSAGRGSAGRGGGAGTNGSAGRGSSAQPGGALSADEDGPDYLVPGVDTDFAPGTGAGAGADAGMGPGLGLGRGLGLVPNSQARPITDIDPTVAQHQPSGIGELDRVLGGGVVPGSAVLLAGEPGVGKSTLLLEVASAWAKTGRTVLILTAEESVGQVRHRAERTGALHENLYLASENDLERALGQIDTIAPELVIVDSIQTMQATGVEGVAGGVAQTRAVTSTLTTLAKMSGIPIIAIGHVTKDGNVAGPRTIEHLVDVVLNFEGDKHSSMRFLRGIKNRFGATDEVGCFEQTSHGIREVADPSGLFLHHRTESVTGTAVTVIMDGRRAMVGELQTLALSSEFKNPKRYVTGMDAGRVSMILAVLSERCGLALAEKEVYAATVGGMKIQEPSADLATGLALASTAANSPLPLGLVAMGEVGLGGEVRRVPQLTQRLAEAARLGFTTALVPARSDYEAPKGMKVREVSTLCDAVRGSGLARGAAGQRGAAGPQDSAGQRSSGYKRGTAGQRATAERPGSAKQRGED